MMLGALCDFLRSLRQFFPVPRWSSVSSWTLGVLVTQGEAGFRVESLRLRVETVLNEFVEWRER